MQEHVQMQLPACLTPCLQSAVSSNLTQGISLETTRRSNLTKTLIGVCFENLCAAEHELSNKTILVMRRRHANELGPTSEQVCLTKSLGFHYTAQACNSFKLCYKIGRSKTRGRIACVFLTITNHMATRCNQVNA